MKVGGMLRDTVAASGALAAISLVSGFTFGHSAVGLGVALGFVTGSVNGILILRLLENGSPFVLSSLGRLALVSAVAILLAYLVSAEPWAVLLGVGGAQIVMVAMAVRQGLRT